MSSQRFFATQTTPSALVIEIRQPVGSLADRQVMNELDQVLAELKQSALQNVIVDFCYVSYFGSSLLEALRTVWNQVHARGGHMVLCHLSPVGREILEIAKFDHLWPIEADPAAAQARLQAFV